MTDVPTVQERHRQGGAASSGDCYSPMAEEGLDALRARVGEDLDLARRLRRIAPERFVDDVRALAAELRLDVTAAELDDAIAQGRQAWALRWIL